ncbi:MAG: DUF401 family protein [Candidatus Nezhaarchaeales archaeon]
MSGIVNSLVALFLSLGFLGIMLFKRAKLGISLNVTAILLAILSMDLREVPKVLYSSVNPITIEGQLALTMVFTAFGIMLLSQLYRETGTMDELNRTLERIINNPKAILSIIPAIIGLLPVAGGALISAPVVDAEGSKLKLSKPRKVYVNIWFRHIILLAYPLSPMFVITIALTRITSTTLILMVLPIMVFMAIIGYVVSFNNANIEKLNAFNNTAVGNKILDLKRFLKSSSPIMVSIVGAIGLGLFNSELAKRGIDVLIATIMGLITLSTVSKMSSKELINSLKSPIVYDITLATYGALLLRSVINASEIPEILNNLIPRGNLSLLLAIAIPMLCGFFSGSAAGGFAISISVLGGLMNIAPKDIALLYMTSYLGYVISPVHLCLAFTIDYFKVSIGKAYKELVPSIFATLIATVVFYVLFP